MVELINHTSNSNLRKNPLQSFPKSGRSHITQKAKPFYVSEHRALLEHIPHALRQCETRQLKLHAYHLQSIDDLYLQIVPGCAHKQKHVVGGVDRHGQQNAVFATLMDLVKQFEAQ